MSNIETLKEFDFKFNKSFGQNFIFDKNFLESIVRDCGITKDTTVVEIGAGAGTLTSMLCEHAKKVYSYEIDNNLKPILEIVQQKYTNLDLTFKDIMKEDIAALEERIGEDYVIVANLPYYITTPIIFLFLDNATKLKSMSIMVQLEVAERITAKPNTADYGAITPSIDFRGDASIIKKVGRHMFTPAPNVDSAIVKIDFKKKYDIIDQAILEKVIKSAFAMRRKTLYNNLKASFNLSKEVLEDVLTKCDLPLTIRGEALDTATFVKLANIISEILK
ncbi:MAG: ribosomal RNA small subunit methyltransferase A [Clostridia bacterium]|nr:ribosomal RNA small subunit methyltransferase A [Clostridia bacterium]